MAGGASVLVGRREELAALEHALAEVERGEEVPEQWNARVDRFWREIDGLGSTTR